MDKVEIVFHVTMIIFFIVFFGFIAGVIIDGLTTEETGTIKVKCIDRVGAVFQDEWCDKTTYCSWLGFLRDKCPRGLK